MVARLPKPSDFRAVFVALGWAGVRGQYGVGAVTINRWINEEGRAALAAERAAYVARLRERDRAFRRRAAMLGTTAGLHDVAAHHLRAERRADQLGTYGSAADPVGIGGHQQQQQGRTRA